MKKFKKYLKSPASAISLFVLAAVLLAFSSIGAARAALTYFSETYASRVQMFDIGVWLLENGDRVSWRDYNSAADGTWNEATDALLANMLGEGEQLKIGKAYDEALSIRNSGKINHYARVTIYKYWEDANGNKMQNLSPGLIDLNLVNLGSDWILDESSSTAERTVLYYNKLLKAGETSVPFTDELTIDSMLATKVTQSEEAITNEKGDNIGTRITTTYDYDGVKFNIEATVDAVQEHNAQDAILSAWGREVTISNNSLALK